MVQHDFRYQHIESALAQLFQVPEPNQAAFRARLRHLRNLGIPTLPKSGSGFQLSYTVDHAIEIMIALELEQLGVAPRHVAEMTKFVISIGSALLKGDEIFFVLTNSIIRKPITASKKKVLMDAPAGLLKVGHLSMSPGTRSIIQIMRGRENIAALVSNANVQNISIIYLSENARQLSEILET